MDWILSRSDLRKSLHHISSLLIAISFKFFMIHFQFISLYNEHDMLYNNKISATNFSLALGSLYSLPQLLFPTPSPLISLLSILLWFLF